MSSLARRLLERVADAGARPSALARLARARGVHGVAFTYHTIRGPELAGQLDHLAEFFQFVSTRELAEERAPGRGSAGKLLAALTFDDGKRSNLVEAGPVLRSRGLPATFFVTVEPARSGTLHWFDLADRIVSRLRELGAFSAGPGPVAHLAPLRALAARLGAPDREVRNLRVLKRVDAGEREKLLEELARALEVDREPHGDDDRSLSPEEVGGLAREGFEIGSHSCTHPILTREAPARARAEIVESRRVLGEWIGSPVREFAYPNGNSSSETEQWTREAGYQRAWTTRPTFLRGGANPHRLPRIEMVPEYDRPAIVLKLAVGLLGGLPNPDGTGYAWRRERIDAA